VKSTDLTSTAALGIAFVLMFALRDRHSPGLVSTNGAASLAATDAARAWRFVEALWRLDVPSSHVYRYYDGLLYTIGLLHASGRFRIILPPR